MTRQAIGLKRDMWVAPRSVVNGVARFGTPVRYSLNYTGLTRTVDIAAFGPSYMDYRRVVAPNAEIENINELDKVWFDSTPSNPADPLASDAEFYVQSKMPGHRVGQVMFRRLTHD
jgi:hypothetical protein